MALDARADAWVRIALARLPPAALAPLLRAFGGPEGIVAASRAQIAAVASHDAAARLREPVDPGQLDAARVWLADPAHEIVAWDDPDYPKALLETAGAPPVLFCIGRRDLFARPALAVVGSRNATPQGVENARAFAQALSVAGLTIVSGLAVGIDAAAHRGALEGQGSTIACMGTGPDRVYPARHLELARAIAQSGLIVSEFPPGTPPLRSNFPRRNRLISGLAKGVLVVEATLSSGSLITARLAGEQGREVFAIPGSIHSPFSRGCHRLIRDGAKLVETAQDVLDELRIAGLGRAPDAPVAATTTAHPEIVDALGSDPCDLDVLVARTGMPPEALAAALVELELEGVVAALPGGRWQRIG